MARWGLAKTTVEDAAREAGVSRATVYRYFPGGRDELISAVVAWEFARLLRSASTRRCRTPRRLEEVMERGIIFAHRSIVEHEVLQRIMQTEPEMLLPALTVESNRDAQAGRRLPGRPTSSATAWPRGSTSMQAADFLARMVLSYIGSRAGGTSTTRTRWPAWSGPSCWPASGDPVTLTVTR